MFFKGKLVVIIPLFIFVIIFSKPVFAEINVTLNEPQDSYVFNSTNNVTFSCNMSTDGDPSYMELYSDFNGSFSNIGSKYLKGLGKENGSVLLMHFNNDFFAGESETHVYDWSGNGNNGTVNDVEYNSSGGKFYGAYEFNGSDNKITVEDSSSLDLLCLGSIEFWMKVKNVAGTKDRVIMKGDSWSGGFPYAIHLDSNIKVYLLLESSYEDIEVASSSNLNYNEWYHVVTTWDCSDDYWNSGDAKIYINGSLDNSYSGNVFPENMFTNNKDLEIGGKATGWGDEKPFNGTLDDLVMYNRVLTPEEVSEHYNASFENVTGAEWNVTFQEDGPHSWNCLSYDNETSNWSSANYTFHIDLQTPPSVNSITLSPGSEDDVDPGVTINVTANITDVSNVSYAIFQYKSSGVSTWNNVTMNNISSDEWNASFTTNMTPDTWDYMIWSNDTLGHSGYSQQYNISAEYDYSWIVSPENLGESYILFDTNGSLGVIVINNTGDYDLNFNITSDFANTYFNISNPNDFDLSAKGKEHININATAPSEPGEYNIRITVNSTTANADPSERIANSTLISYWGGPYLTANIVEYESIVVQSTSGINYSAKVRNIGNETATNVWINWTLPSGWSNTSGNLSYFVGDLSSGSVAWNNITAYISSSASARVSYLYVNTNSSNDSSANTSIQVSVICSDSDGVCGTGCSYVTDDDCSPPSGGTGGTATVYPSLAKDYEIVLDIPSRLDINRGDSKTFKVGVKNPVSGTRLDNVYLSLSGYPQTFVSVTPSYLTGIGYDEMKYFEVEIKAPVYAVYEEYDLSGMVKGEFIETGKTTSAEKTGGMLIVTQKFVENETLRYFESAKEALEEINKSGFETKEMNEMLEEIELALKKGNYDKVKELSEDVIEIKDLALELNGQIEEMGKDIENLKQQNFNLPETEKMLFLAKSAFQRGDYERAEERMSNALLMYNMEITNAGFWILIYNYWWLISAVLIVSGGGTMMTRRRFIIKSIKKNLDSLVEDEKTIMNLIIKLQEEHFLERKIGLEEYQNMMENYEEYIAGMGERRIEVISKLVGMLRVSKAIKKLKEEGRRVEDRIKELQKDYFELGNIGRRYYDNLIGSLKNEMIEIEKMIDMVGSEGNV